MLRRLAVLLLMVSLVAVACGGKSSGGSAPVAAGPDDPLTGATAAPTLLGGSGPLAKTKVYKGLTQNHVEGPIRYRQTPPVGGDHAPPPGWQNCGAYTSPIGNPNGVHSLEHGAVWITYRPSLPAAQVKTLTALIPANPYLLISPWTDDKLPSPIVLTGWGVQLGVPSADDPAVKAFIAQFEQGPQTPEPGALCSGGTGSPSTVSRAPVSN